MCPYPPPRERAFPFRWSNVYVLWIALLYRYSSEHHTHLTSMQKCTHVFTPLRLGHLQHTGSVMHEKCAVDG